MFRRENSIISKQKKDFCAVFFSIETGIKYITRNKTEKLKLTGNPSLQTILEIPSWNQVFVFSALSADQLFYYNLFKCVQITLISDMDIHRLILNIQTLDRLHKLCGVHFC